MVLPGIVRKLNKNLPALLQTLFLVCLIHFVAQTVLTKVHKKYQLSENEPQHSKQIIRTGHGGRTKPGGGFTRSGSRPVRKFSPSPRPIPVTRTTTTTTTTTPVPPPPDDIVEQEQKRRVDTLQKACTRWNLGLWSHPEPANISQEDSDKLATMPLTPLYQVLIVAEKNKLAVCPAARMGVQWLARRMLRLTGKFDEEKLKKLPEPPGAVMRNNYPYLSSWEKYPIVLKESLTVLMARHPLDRLLASYRHILENPDRNPHGYLHYGRRIVKKYRKAPVTSKGPTFDEFIQFLLEHDSRHMEEAWQSVIRRCTPCHIPYNTVIHFETLWHDVQWLWQKAGLGPLNTTDYVKYSLTPEIRKQYFSELTLSQVLKLYTKYKLDFELYGYSLEEHMAYVKPGEEMIDPELINHVPKRNLDMLQKALQAAQERAQLLEKDKGEFLVAPLGISSSSMNASLIGERGPLQSVESLLGERGKLQDVDNRLDPAEDYRGLPPQAPDT